MSWLDDLLGKVIMLGGTELPQRKNLNFLPGDNASITIEDNPSLGTTDVTIGAGSPGESVTVDQAPTMADNGKSFNNVGAGGMVTINLPANPSVGFRIHALVADAQYIKLKANTSQTITYDALTSALAGYVRSNYKGAKMTIEAVSTTRWMCHSDRGPWDVDV